MATPGALQALERAGQAPIHFLLRHTHGDWGELDAHDRQVNETALHDGCRLLSAYRTKHHGVKIWVITEADRSVTTFLLPEEY
jgi:hypothetical protein